MSLTNKALLVNLAISQWTARKLDKNETQQLAARHNTAAEVARVNKSLFPMARELDQIHKLTGEIRTIHYELTLPWAIDGSRILTSAAYLDYVAAVRPKLATWESYVRDFIREYPRLKAEARVMLNGLYREDDYPEARVVERKFKADVSFFPVPDAEDFRVSISAEEERAIREDLERSLKSAQQIAMQDCWNRLHEVVSKAATVLQDPRAIFRDSLVENARDLCALLPKLNLADDPELERMRREVEGSLCAHTPEVLRQPGVTRAEVANKMSDLINKMGAFYQHAA